MFIFWTDLSKYYPDRQEAIYDLQEKYARKCKIRNTLVIEMVGTFLHLIDPSDPELRFNDPSVKQVKCIIEDQVFVAIVKLWPMGLIP